MNCGVLCNLAKTLNGKYSNSSFNRNKNNRDGGLDASYFKIAGLGSASLCIPFLIFIGFLKKLFNAETPCSCHVRVH